VKDALAVAETAQRLDPYNTSFEYLLKNLKQIDAQETQSPPPAQVAAEVAQLEKEIKPGSTNFMQQFELAQKLIQLGQNDRAYQVLDNVLTNPQATIPMVMSVADAYNRLGQPQKLQGALQALTRLAPDSPEAWYDLAASQATFGQDPAALDSLKKALQLNDQRLKQNPKAADIRQTLMADARFAKVRETPEFKALPGH
jgi:tetratricopeptide (TPR) repeat protein